MYFTDFTPIYKRIPLTFKLLHKHVGSSLVQTQISTTFSSHQAHLNSMCLHMRRTPSVLVPQLEIMSLITTLKQNYFASLEMLCHITIPGKLMALVQNRSNNLNILDFLFEHQHPGKIRQDWQPQKSKLCKYHFVFAR